MFETYNMEDILTGKEAAAVAMVSPQTISYWASKGILPVHDRDNSKRPLYRRGDVYEAEKQTRRSPNSRRTALAA